jgi:hypothetical protein
MGSKRRESALARSSRNADNTVFYPRFYRVHSLAWPSVDFPLFRRSFPRIPIIGIQQYEQPNARTWGCAVISPNPRQRSWNLGVCRSYPGPRPSPCVYRWRPASGSRQLHSSSSSVLCLLLAAAVLDQVLDMAFHLLAWVHGRSSSPA